MEEKKKPGRKPANRSTQGQEPDTGSAKLSYEELTNVANQLSMQNRRLMMEVRRLNLDNMFKRLDYLFKVVENGHMFSDSFLGSCTDEIEKTLVLTDDDGQEETEEETE